MKLLTQNWFYERQPPGSMQSMIFSKQPYKLKYMRKRWKTAKNVFILNDFFYIAMKKKTSYLKNINLNKNLNKFPGFSYFHVKGEYTLFLTSWIKVSAQTHHFWFTIIFMLIFLQKFLLSLFFNLGKDGHKSFFY